MLVWVDTAFNGSLVLPEQMVNELSLPQQSTAEAILANGNKVELATYGCAIKWFGKSYISQVTTNVSDYGLLGTMLLRDKRLIVDFRDKIVTIE